MSSVLLKFRLKKGTMENFSYERCVYESVDDKCLFLSYISIFKGKKVPPTNGLNCLLGIHAIWHYKLILTMIQYSFIKMKYKFVATHKCHFTIFTSIFFET